MAQGSYEAPASEAAAPGRDDPDTTRQATIGAEAEAPPQAKADESFANDIPSTDDLDAAIEPPVSSYEPDLAPADSAGEAASSEMGSVAAALVGDRTLFLQVVTGAIGPNIAPALQRALRRAADPASDELMAFERLATVAIDEGTRAVAAIICAALAARTTTQLLRHSTLDAADAESLAEAWLDAANQVSGARGSEGLRLLLPMASLLARKAEERGEPVPEIANALRRIAPRLAADPALARALGRSSPNDRRDRLPRGMSGPPRRIVIQGPVEIRFHAR